MSGISVRFSGWVDWIWQPRRRTVLFAAVATGGVVAAALCQPWTGKELDDAQTRAIEALTLGAGGILIGAAIDLALSVRDDPLGWIISSFTGGLILTANGLATAVFGWNVVPLRPITAISIGLGILGALSGYAVVSVFPFVGSDLERQQEERKAGEKENPAPE